MARVGYCVRVCAFCVSFLFFTSLAFFSPAAQERAGRPMYRGRGRREGGRETDVWMKRAPVIVVQGNLLCVLGVS